MICPNCGHPAKDTDRFCVKCATKLIEDMPAEAAEEIAEAAEQTEPFMQQSFFAEEPVRAPEPEFVPEPEPVYAPAPEPVFVPEPAAEPARVEEPAAAPETVEEPYKDCPSICKPLTTWGFVWRILLFCIPVFNMIPLFIMAFASGINKNSKSFARAVLLLMLISFVIALVCAAVLLFVYNWDKVADTIGTIFN